MTAQALEVRPYRAEDEPAVLTLLQASLGWVPDDDYARFFAWKHHQSPFGRSPAYVAADGDRVVGFRTFLRWEFVGGDGSVVRAVRAVDTATHPEYQGRGIFTLLTRHALDDLRDERVSFVFNTPNDASRPGYLKMGWQLVGRLPVLARSRSVRTAGRVLGARKPAQKWSLTSAAGRPVADVLASSAPVEQLLSSMPARRGLETHRTAGYLRWRYGFEPLAYRAVLAGAGVEHGLVVYRLRQRGAAVEAAICEELVPDSSELAALLRRVLTETGADYAVRLASAGTARAGFIPVPRQGPTLVWRGVADQDPPAAGWRLTLGDVELF